MTFDDVSAAIDQLATHDVDTSRVVAVGHSAGGHLAAWAAARLGAVVPVTGVVAQAGVLDLTTAVRDRVGGTAVRDLLGGGPDDVPDRYDAADPMRHVPLPVPVVCVHAPADAQVPIALSERYVEASGGNARLIRASGDHFTLIDPASPDWSLVVDALPQLLARP
jgi:dipeptidyl aminopeptidase/acylaminoacyl peptidase